MGRHRAAGGSVRCCTSDYCEGACLVETRPKDYFEIRAEQVEAKQRQRYQDDPPKDDDLSRHMRELRESDLIQNFRLISTTYQQ